MPSMPLTLRTATLIALIISALSFLVGLRQLFTLPLEFYAVTLWVRCGLSVLFPGSIALFLYVFYKHQQEE